MLKQLKISGFQSLSNVSLSLGKLTVIVGETDSGKSALIRAIRGLVNNKAGKDFVSVGQRDARVEAELDEGNSIIWLKGKENKYSIKTSAGEQDFEKCGVDSPEEVKKLLKMSPRSIGKVTFNPNFHLQFDTPFLLDTSTVSALEVAKILGEITNINLLYGASKEAKSRIMSVRQTLGIRKRDLEEVREGMKKYADVEEREKVLNDIKQDITSLEGKEQEMEGWMATRFAIESENVKLEESRKTESQIFSVVEAYKELPVMQESIQLYSSLQELFGRVKKADEEYVQLVEAERIRSGRVVVLKEVEGFDSKIKELGDLEELCGKLQIQSGLLSQLRGKQGHMEGVEIFYREGLGAFKERNKACPLCGSLWKDKG